MGDEAGNITETGFPQIILTDVAGTIGSPEITEEIGLVDDGRLEEVLTLGSDTGNKTETVWVKVILANRRRGRIVSPKITEKIRLVDDSTAVVLNATLGTDAGNVAEAAYSQIVLADLGRNSSSAEVAEEIR